MEVVSTNSLVVAGGRRGVNNNGAVTTMFTLSNTLYRWII